MNLLKPETKLTPEERRHIIPSNRKTPKRAIEQEAIEATSAIVKQRTQLLQQRILDGFLGVDDTDPYRVTRLIKKLMDHKPDLALRLLAKILPSMSDADLQKNIPKAQATIQIFNQSIVPAQNDNSSLITNTGTNTGTMQCPQNEIEEETDLILDVETIEIEE